jgi:cell wall-associated NlpC family hydrolase
MEFAAYCRRPFEERTRCWGLLRAFYREQLGIELPAYESASEDETATAIAQGESPRWTRLYPAGTPSGAMLAARPRLHRPGDAVALSVAGAPLHVGIVAPDRDGRQRMLHVERGQLSGIEVLDGARWKERITGFYRHASLTGPDGAG